MRLFSNFDSWLEKRLVDQYQQNFGASKVISVHKSRRFYISRVLAPYIRLVIIFALWLTLVYGFEYPYKSAVLWVFWLGMLFFALYIVRRSSKEYVDYKMDFMIVTPKEVIKYNQTWILHRETETIHVDKIRSVTVAKHWFFESFFDIGTITFLAEWDTEKWDIVMPSIDAVESIEQKIRDVMWLSS